MKLRSKNTLKLEKCTLVLQGGGALGAYQAGVFEALADNGLSPTWVAGTSIGAINAALIAGNPPERRVARLREFWEGVSSHLQVPAIPEAWTNMMPDIVGTKVREWWGEANFLSTTVTGVPGFFKPRVPPASLSRNKSLAALSYYDTSPLKETLLRLVDFDLLNTQNLKNKVRLSIGAVNIETGNLIYFDTASMPKNKRITPEHIMASGALPPAFAPIKIDGAWYWDGGIVSNNPLQYVIDQPITEDMLVFEVDLFNARGSLPKTLGEVSERVKEIQYSSRTRLNTTAATEHQRLAHAAKNLATKLPAKFVDDPDMKTLLQLVHGGSQSAVTVLLLIYRSKHFETQSKDAEFSRHSVLDHWHAGVDDVKHSFKNPLWSKRSKPEEGITVLDLTRPS
jgi:NTE family protein